MSECVLFRSRNYHVGALVSDFRYPGAKRDAGTPAQPNCLDCDRLGPSSIHRCRLNDIYIYTYRKIYCTDKVILQLSYLYNEISSIGKKTLWNWIRVHVIREGCSVVICWYGSMLSGDMISNDSIYVSIYNNNHIYPGRLKTRQFQV